MTIGLCGAHRTGKTTLARQYAEKHGIQFVETSVSSIWREMGLDPGIPVDFETRLTVQEEILKRIDAKLANYAGLDFITDRTPLDMAAYTLADAIHGTVPDGCQERLANYVNACFESTNKRFSIVLLVQPGIVPVHEEGKAIINAGYMEHLNSLMLGLTVDERLACSHFYMPRSILGMQERLDALSATVERCRSRANAEYAEASKSGAISVH